MLWKNPILGLFTLDLLRSSTLASLCRLFAARAVSGMLLSLLQKQKGQLGRVPGGSIPHRCLAPVAVFNGLVYKKHGCCKPPQRLIKVTTNNKPQAWLCGFAALLCKQVIARKSPLLEGVALYEGESMMSFDILNIKAPSLDFFPKKYLIFVALGCPEKENYWPVNNCPLACFSRLKTMFSKLAARSALNICFASDYLQHPVNLVAFHSFAKGVSPMFFPCVSNIWSNKKKKRNLAHSYCHEIFWGQGSLRRRCGTQICMSWQRPGLEGSSCFYEPGNCRLSSGCASCPYVSKFHIIIWVSVELWRWRKTYAGTDGSCIGGSPPWRGGHQEMGRPGEDKMLVGENI